MSYSVSALEILFPAYFLSNIVSRQVKRIKQKSNCLAWHSIKKAEPQGWTPHKYSRLWQIINSEFIDRLLNINALRAIICSCVFYFDRRLGATTWLKLTLNCAEVSLYPWNTWPNCEIVGRNIATRLRRRRLRINAADINYKIRQFLIKTFTARRSGGSSLMRITLDKRLSRLLSTLRNSFKLLLKKKKINRITYTPSRLY